MAPAKKAAARKAVAPSAAVGGPGVAALRPYAERAVAALQDPETRQMVVDNGQRVVDYMRQWREQRPTPSPAEADGDDGPAFRVFHQRLVRREQRVRSALAVLVGGNPKVGDALAPVAEALDRVVTALAVAEALPLRSRRKAHRAIDDVLDDVEDQLLAAGLGLTGPADLDG